MNTKNIVQTRNIPENTIINYRLEVAQWAVSVVLVLDLVVSMKIMTILRYE